MKLSLLALTFISLALSNVHAADEEPQPPKTEADNVFPDPNLSKTDIAAIEATVLNVNQTSSVDPVAPPNQPPAATEVTAVDGEITEAGTAAKRDFTSSYPKLQTRLNKGNVVNLKAEERGISDYIKVFDASSSARDASVQGTAYLTYKLVSNSTYNVNDCLVFCDSVPACRFANLYYEFNNPLYDWVFSEKSNLACALYGDVHTAAEKTNFASQQLKPLPEPLTSITRSTGWAKETPFIPDTPAGYSLSFGPLPRATVEDSSLGFSALSTYDVDGCAALCNSRTPDPLLGACQSFNIWRGLVDRTPTTYICQLYAKEIDASTATNGGNINFEITNSRGYNRISVIPYARFLISNDWVISGGFNLGFTSFGHLGRSSFFNGNIAYPRTFNPSIPLRTGFMTNRVRFPTTPGRRYTFQLWYWQDPGQNDFFIKWNGVQIWNSPLPQTAGEWLPLTFVVTGSGIDQLEFSGGGYLSYQYLSDFSLFLN